MGHDQQDMDFFFKELKFDFIKVDYCGAQTGNNVDNLDLPEQERYTEIYQAIKNTKRRGVRYNICRWAFPGTWVHDIATSWRTTEDIEMSWTSIKSIISQSLYLSAYTGGGKYNDMDMLEVGRGLSKEEDKTHFGMWCIMSSPLLIGCDLHDIKGNALELMQNEELIALNQNELGLQAYVVEKENDCYILVKDVEELYGKKRAVAVYNPSNGTKTVNVNFSMLDLAGEVKARDLFERTDAGTFTGEMSVIVPAHGTRIYTLEAAERLERTVYEAETAWLSEYQELWNNESRGTAIYSEKAGASGGAIVGWLGNRAINDLQWRTVQSETGGLYKMTLSFITGENRNIKISVNGGEPISASLNGGSWSNIAQKDFEITLNKGNNTVRLYSDAGWMADIDCMTLQLLEPTGIQNATTADNLSVEVSNSTITITTAKSTKVTIVDMAGKQVWSGMVQGKKSVTLPAGTYLVNDKKVLVK